jgi:F-type H+-transporting ATPase subunit gamma
VVVAADRGLSGAYNSSVIRAAERSMQRQRSQGRQTRLITVGKKAQTYFRFRGWHIDQAYLGISDSPSYEDARLIADYVTTRFERGEYDLVELAYTQFLSAATQKVTIRRFVPLDPSILTQASDGPSADYEFEPNPQEILDRLLPRYAEARLYAALLEGTASFFAAQQRAMKSATDNAEELIVKYSRAMNRARQDAITTEIMEIVGGAEAMRQAQSDRSDLLIDQALTSADVLSNSLNRSRS